MDRTLTYAEILLVEPFKFKGSAERGKHWKSIAKMEGQQRRQPEAIDFTRSAEFAHSRRCDVASRM